MTAQITQTTQGAGGNTSPQQKQQRSRKWCFTLNNYTVDNVYTITQAFSLHKYVLGREVGEEGTPHLQGYVEFTNGKSFTVVKKIMPTAHIEKAKGSTKQNFDYCTKDGDYDTNIDLTPFKDKVKQICLNKYKDTMWRDWQKDILDMLDKDPDPRKINWFWEPTGNVGKSYLCKYIALTKDCIICDGKKDNIFNQIKTCMDEEKLPTIILMDVPRCSLGYVNYNVIEQVKNGLIYSGKYEGGQCIFPEPHVIVFANEPPDIDQMSRDRWIIIELSES